MRSRRRLPTTSRNRGRVKTSRWARRTSSRTPRRREVVTMPEIAQGIEISEAAANKIRSLMAKQGISEGGLRVGVKGGGCSGLSYTFSWEREPRFGDEMFEGHGAKIFVDKKSLLFLRGTMLDYD